MSRFRIRFLITPLLAVVCIYDHSLQAQVSYNQQIRPIFSQHCTACHGPDESAREADFRIDLPDEAMGVIEPGDPDGSEVFSRITSEDDDERMPPPEHGNPLNKKEVDLVRQWISQGANYQSHWSFVPPIKPEPPSTEHSDWVRNEIDRFVTAKLDQQQLSPSRDAEPRRLIRRLALDLTGLPPSRDMVERFAEHPTDATYADIVDQLLADKSFGEHWAAMWLDMARYADTLGYAGDEVRDIWPWRDWVIRAMNENMPFDQFTIEQLAGDLLPKATDSQRLATAFHRNTLNNTEGGTNDELFRTIAVKDRISTTMNVWMGLTMRCAECHSHKYDPITHAQYYEFLDFFNQTADTDKMDEQPRMDTYPAGRESEFAILDAEIEKLEGLPDPLDSDRKKIAELHRRRGTPIRVPIMQELPEKQRRKTHIMKRGNFQSLGDQVAASTPKSFHPMPDDAPNNRLGVAKWLVSPENPLTARVTVNRFWARLFGRGIVATEEDFGTQGDYPTHPQLLDWLAVDFRENGWDVKRLLKQIALSSTYRQSSYCTSQQLQQDADNLYLSRGPRNRLSAESVRDQVLAVSGLLSRRMYGPPVYPPNPIKQVTNAFKGAVVWNTSTGEDRYRRAIYTHLKRSAPHPLFETFDISTRDVCSLRRIPTNTPLQSFMTLNDESFVEAAQFMAARMSKESDVEHQIAHGLQRALLRPADSQQVAVLRKLFQNTENEYRSNVLAARKMAGSPGTDKTDDEAIRLAALTVVANVIMNLDSFLTK